jgi:hypothetical protein
MATAPANRTDVETVLVEVTSLLLERARAEVEREIQAGRDSAGDDAATNLRRMRELEEALRTIRQERSIAAAEPAPELHHREVSRYYEVPGQEDA